LLLLAEGGEDSGSDEASSGHLSSREHGGGSLQGGRHGEGE
jgi:hypothetical protein